MPVIVLSIYDDVVEHYWFVDILYQINANFKLNMYAIKSYICTFYFRLKIGAIPHLKIMSFWTVICLGCSKLCKSIYKSIPLMIILYTKTNILSKQKLNALSIIDWSIDLNQVVSSLWVR